MLPFKKFEKNDEFYMKEALKEARKAYNEQEVPVGAVIVYEGKIIARGHNQSIGLNDPTTHAEMLAIRQAAKHLDNYRLLKTQIYVTVEPCIMCLGALIWARVDKIIFGAKEPKSGMVEDYLQLLKKSTKVNHKIEICGGVLEKESKLLLWRFFKHRRKK